MKALWLLPLALALGACSSKGKVREPAELTRIESPAVAPYTEWSRRVGHGKQYSRLQVMTQADALFVADQQGEVQALDPRDGRSIWRSATGARLIAGPGVVDDLILVGSLDGEVIALDRADGSERWRRTLSSEILAVPTGAGPVVVARSVDGRVYGLDSSDGTVRWSFERGVPSLTLRGLSAPLIHGGRVFVGMDNGRMASLDPATGQLIWEQLIAAPSGRSELDRLADIDADLVPNGTEVYVASAGGEIASVDGETGQVLWRHGASSYTGLTVIDDRVIVSDTRGHVWALDARTGASIWRQQALEYRRLSTPEVLGRLVVIGDFEGYLHWLDPASGDIVGRTRAGNAPLQGPPSTLEDRLIVLNRDGRLAAVGLKD